MSGVFLCLFIGPIESFWVKQAPTSLNGYQIMRPLRFGRPGSHMCWVCGFIRGPLALAEEEKQQRPFEPLDAGPRVVLVD